MAIARRIFDKSLLLDTALTAPVVTLQADKVLAPATQKALQEIAKAAAGFVYQPRKPAFVPSPQQADFFEFVRNGQGNCILRAVAGAGKTTTLIQALKLMDGQVFFGAYNKKIADEIKLKAAQAKADRPGIYISTMHAAGFRTWMQVYKSRVDDKKVMQLVDEMVRARRLAASTPSISQSARDQAMREVQSMAESMTFITKMVSFGKQYLIGITSDLHADRPWMTLVQHFSADEELPGGVEVATALVWVREIYQQSIDHCKEVIDFDDMIFAPLFFNCRFFKYDWVLGDEWQDTNPARLEMACRMLKDKGRFLGVGDECQPPGTMVEVAVRSGPYQIKERKQVAIEDLRVGDEVTVFNFEYSHIVVRKILGISSRIFNGQLIKVSAGGYASKYTPNHKCIVKNKAVGYCVYIMSRNGRFRIGMSKLWNDNLGCGPFKRLVAENGDSVWILKCFADRREALVAEAALSAIYHLPQLMFTAKTSAGCLFKQQELDAIWRSIDNVEQAAKCLQDFGRDIEYPYFSGCYDRGEQASLRRPHEVYACNILEGSQVQLRDKTWARVELSRIPHRGLVYSLSVDKEKNYYADGILTHNCQAIYGFAGAGSDSLAKTIERLNCKLLPLTVTYRCAQNIVAHAHQWVNHIQAHPSAPEGVVRPAKIDPAVKTPDNKIVPWFIQDAPSVEDAVLCRFTKPLIATAYGMLRAGVACKVEGRDLGLGLIKLAQRWKISRIDALDAKLDDYLANEVRKAQIAKNTKREDEVIDRVATLRIFMDRCKELKRNDIASLVSEINSMFADNVAGAIVLSTGHKAKGREWPRVFWIQHSDRPGRGENDWRTIEESNIKYVITTRAISELILVPEIKKDTP